MLGLGLLLVGGVGSLYQSTLFGFTLCLISAGYGWGMATIGATATLHHEGRPSAAMLALHDGALFLAALIGVALFGRF